jgi:L-serine dehydratase
LNIQTVNLYVDKNETKKGCSILNVFDIIGPIMIGPSSSHTAGAVRIGAITRQLLAVEPFNVSISFYGSFAKTYKGHGTDKAIIGGLLGMSTDDECLRDSIDIAASRGMKYEVHLMESKCEHPNAVFVEAEGKLEGKVNILGFSIGGGNVVIKKLNGTDVEFTAQFNTLIVPHYDLPGTIAAITTIFGKQDINIAFMKVYRSKHRGESIMIIETDQYISEELRGEVSRLPSVKDAKIVTALN